jgi:deoxyribonuclease-4
MLLGAHVSTAGGLANAPQSGRAIRADVIQIFTRNQRQWRARPVTRAEAAAFRRVRRECGIQRVFAHASYLINLASPERATRQRGCAALVAEVERCAALGVDGVIFHPGAHMDAGMSAGLATVARSLDSLFDRVGRTPVRVLIEITAGQGSSVGHSFEQLAEIVAHSRNGARLGVCLDTCHLLAAGYDLISPAGYRAMWRAFDRTLGRDRLAAIHLNDSRKGLGSRVDRHAPIGKGLLGRETFRRIMNDRRLARVPLILETPGPEPAWRREIALLRRLGRPRQ